MYTPAIFVSRNLRSGTMIYRTKILIVRVASGMDRDIFGASEEVGACRCM